MKDSENIHFIYINLMKKTLFTILTVLGAGSMAMAANFNTATPYVDASVKAGAKATFDVVVATDAVVSALEDAGQQVNDWRTNDVDRHLYVWDGTFVAGATDYPGVGYSDLVSDGYPSLTVANVGWSGAGYTMDPSAGINTTHWTDDTRIHIAYRTNSPAPASVAFIIADGGVNGTGNPAKVAVGTNFIDGSATYPSVGDALTTEWQAIDLSFADLKAQYPSFSYAATEAWEGNILSFLAGGQAGTSVCIDAVYFYTPAPQEPVSNISATINPAPGPIANGFPYQTTVNWNNLPLELLGEGSDIKVLVDGEENWNASVWVAFLGVKSPIYDEYDPVDEGESSPTLVLQVGVPYLESGSARISLEIPEGFVRIDGKEVNAAQTFDYTLVAVSEDNLNFEPQKGSNIFSLSTVEMTWNGYKLSKNPACTETVMYGKYSWDTGLTGAEEVKTITYNSDGSITFDLGKEYSVNGEIAIVIPKNYFLIEVDGISVPYAEEIFISYTCASYITLPKPFGITLGKLESFAVEAQESIEFTGNLAAIKITQMGESCATVKSVSNTTIDGLPAVEFLLTEPILPGYYTITIPEGALKIDGTTTDYIIEWTFSVNEDGTPTPKNGAKIRLLDQVSLSWQGQEIEINDDCTGEIVLEYGSNKVNVTGKASVVTTQRELWEDYFLTTYSLLLDFSEAPYTADGAYTITIPARFVYLPEDDLYNNEIVINYTVDSSLKPLEPATLVDPTSDYVTSIGFVTLTWDRTPIDVTEGAEVTLSYNGEEYYLPVFGATLVEDENGGIAGFDDFPTPDVGVGDEEDVYRGISILDFPFELFGSTGDFTYTIPEGIVSDMNGRPNPEQSITLHVLPITTVPMTITPECENYGQTTVARLDEITLSWGDKTAEIVNGENIRLNETVLIGMDDTKDNTIVFSLGNLADADGEYEFVMSDGAVLIGGNELNSEFVCTYIVDVNSLVKFAEAEEDGLYRVYNFNGVNVLTTGNADDLRTLENGLYIINGRKVLINK